MPFQLGNKFWELRLKHGRDSAISTPSELWENFIEYSQWCFDNPLIEIDYKGKDATQVELPKMRAMTKDAFALACGLSGWDVINRYKERTDHDFIAVITRIEKYIYQQKFEGSAAGFLNPNIIAAELGLKTKTEVDHKNNGGSFEYTNKSTDELVERAKAIKTINDASK